MILTDDEARTLYQTGDSAHDFDHVLRVARMAETLARAEDANVEIVRLAALLHDVPVPPDHVPASSDIVSQNTDKSVRMSHHLIAAHFAYDFLLQRGMSVAVADQVKAAIESHRFRDRSRPPQTLEAKCLYDADKLDAMGAIGVARAFAYAGSHANRLYARTSAAIEQGIAAGAPEPQGSEYTPVHEYVYKLQRLLDTLYTSTARKIGMERHAFMLAFFSQLEGEMTGER